MTVVIERVVPPSPTAASRDGAAILALEAATQDRPLTLDAVLQEAQPGGSDGVVLLARAGDDGEVVGMGSARAFVDEVHVMRLAVDGRCRRRGTGRRLLDALLAWADERRATAVLLEVRAGNTAALALYAAAGFVVEGRRPHYYPDGEDALLLRRTSEAGAGAGAGAGRG